MSRSYDRYGGGGTPQQNPPQRAPQNYSMPSRNLPPAQDRFGSGGDRFGGGGGSGGADRFSGGGGGGDRFGGGGGGRFGGDQYGDTQMGGYNTPPPAVSRAPVARQQPQQYSEKALPGRMVELSLLEKNPGGNTFAFSNLAAVSPLDFGEPEGSDLYLKLSSGQIITARVTSACQPGWIGLGDRQRNWIGFDKRPNQIVAVQRYDPFSTSRQGNVYLVKLDAEVNWASKKVDIEFDPDELSKMFKDRYDNQLLCPGQVVIMDTVIDARSHKLDFIIKKVTVGPLGAREGEEFKAPGQYGLLHDNTLLALSPMPKSGIALKGSMALGTQNAILSPDFKFEDMGIGGLDSEFGTIFRRAFSSRLYPPGAVERMGIQHVRGMLLYGPPGTGKTLIARKIGQMLNAREPKIINGPEVLNKFVGQSEENIRKIFADAEKEWKEVKERSQLHIIIFDELDAVCKQRGSGAGGGTGVGDSVVNQLLTKLDGVETAGNFLMIGMTNRMDMIDEALLRPGRLELHVEISLPDEHGRVQILNIHTEKMRQNEFLGDDVDIPDLAKQTKNYSGAEIAGLVRAAASFAFGRHTEIGKMAKLRDDIKSLKVTASDFRNALEETKPLFGVSEEELEQCIEGGIIRYSPAVQHVMDICNEDIEAVRSNIGLNSILLWGPSGSGKTALAATLALNSEFPFIKMITPKNMVGMGEAQKVSYMEKVFRDADKSNYSIVIVDDVDLVFDYVRVGLRFSNTILSSLRSLLTRAPPAGRHRLVIGTTRQRQVIEDLDLSDAFSHQIAVPNVSSREELRMILEDEAGPHMPPADVNQVLAEVESGMGRHVNIGIKRVLHAANTAKSSPRPVATCAELIINRSMRDYKQEEMDFPEGFERVR